MSEFLAGVVFWHWWILAGLLLILELLVPAAFFIWIASAAGVVGLLLLIFSGMGWPLQLVLFSILSLVSVIAARRYIQNHLTPTDQPSLNRRGEQYIGRVFDLEAAIVNGVGRIKVGDGHWRVQGKDAPLGSKVRVVDLEGASFVVSIVEDHA